MKNIKKLTLLAISATLTTVLFTGCSSEEKSLSEIFTKNQNITSSEFKTDLGIRFTADNLSDVEKQGANEIIPMLNGAKITLQGKANISEDGNAMKMQANIGAKVGDKPFTSEMWLDINEANGKNQFKEVIKLPAEAAKEMGGKEYFVIDSSKMADDTNVNPEIAKLSTEMQKKFSKLMESSMSNFNPAFNLVSSTGYTFIDTPQGRKLVRTFEVNLNDKKFKDLIKYTSNDLVNNKDARNLLKEYVTTVTKISAKNDAEAKASESEIDKAFSEFDSKLPEFTKNMNKILNTFDNVPIIGDKGITITYAVDENGYIINEKGNIDLVFDAPKFMSAVQQLGGSNEANKLTGVYKLGIDFNSYVFNINSNIQIQLPEVNSENSIQADSLAKTANQTVAAIK